MISREEVLNLASLARLKLEDKEIEALQKDISSILEYVGQLRSFDTQGSTLDQGSPRSNLATLNHNVMRDDTPYKDGAMLLGKREALLKAFPVREGDYNVVRKIIQKDE